MVEDYVTRDAAGDFTIGVVIISVGNLVGGFLASSTGILGLGLYLVIALPALYFGLIYVARGMATVVEGVHGMYEPGPAASGIGGDEGPPSARYDAARPPINGADEADADESEDQQT